MSDIKWDEEKIKNLTLGEKEDNINLLSSFDPLEAAGWIEFFIPFVKVPKSAKAKREAVRKLTSDEVTKAALLILTGWKVPDPKDESSDAP